MWVFDVGAGFVARKLLRVQELGLLVSVEVCCEQIYRRGGEYIYCGMGPLTLSASLCLVDIFLTS